MNTIFLSGLGKHSLQDALRTTLKQTNPKVIGIASAFVSVTGVQELVKILGSCGKPKCLLIAGIDNSITHPESLYMARRFGWQVKLGVSPSGIFHPKLIIAGMSLSRSSKIGGVRSVYVGSSNLTAGGLCKNLECGLIAEYDNCPESAAASFLQMWDIAEQATDDAIRNYSARFAECARARKVIELEHLGVSETQTIPSNPKGLRRRKPPAQPALGTDFAVAAWAGLQSFTGGFRFQLEFPKAAAAVIRRLIPRSRQKKAKVDVFCPDDGTTRSMQYGFYEDNGMFRLNIPNDAPGVGWARVHKDGIAFIERGPTGGAPLRLRIMEPSAEVTEIIGRSVALGTWGRTPTRIFGWF